MGKFRRRKKRKIQKITKYRCTLFEVGNEMGMGMGNTALYAINEFPFFSLFLPRRTLLFPSFDERRSRPGCGRDATGCDGTEWKGREGKGREWQWTRTGAAVGSTFVRLGARSSIVAFGPGRGHRVVVIVSCRGHSVVSCRVVYSNNLPS